MMRMRIPEPLVYALLIGASLLTLVVFPNTVYSRAHGQFLELGLLDRADRMNLFQEVLHRTEQTQRNFTNDYTFWDDMISFADGKLDDQWGEDNIAVGVASFGVEGVWVVDRRGIVRYGVRAAPGGQHVRDDALPVSLDDVKAAVGTEPIAIFYRRIGGLAYVVMAAGIVPTEDAARATPPQGWFITVNAIDDVFLRDLGEGTGTRVTILPPGTGDEAAWMRNEETGTYAFWVPLEDEKREQIGVLQVERSSEVLAALLRQSGQERSANRFVFTGIAMLLAIITYLLNRARVQALAYNRVLEEDVDRRKRTETELRARTEELDKMNKALVARELRMVELKKELGQKAP